MLAIKHHSRLITWMLILFITTVEAGCSKGDSPKKSSPLTSLIQTAPDFTAQVFYHHHEKLLYRLLRPEHYLQGKEYPLVVFLSGTLERGNDNIRQLKYIGPLFENPENRKKYPCWVMVPQCPREQNWVTRESYFGSVKQAPNPARPLWLTVIAIHALEYQKGIDTRRIYTMGISSGGSGVWDLLARYPGLFAAGVPMSGSGDSSKAAILAKTPVWIFHGGLDLVVNPNTSRIMNRALLKAGGDPKYTEYPGVGHTCWVKAFRDPRLLKWLFRQKRS